jgi:hypothetical protein
METMLIVLWKFSVPGVGAALDWLFREHWPLTLAALVLLAAWLERWRFLDAARLFRAGRSVLSRARDFSIQEIERGFRHYVWPDSQSIAPGPGDAALQAGAVRRSLCDVLDEFFVSPAPHRHAILLADPGMGKSSFLLNYFARYLWGRRRTFHMELLSLGSPGFADRLLNIRSPQKTMLLLDAFEEDVEANRDAVSRLGRIIDLTKGFDRVVIASDTSFFPLDDEIAREVPESLKVAPEQAAGSSQFAFSRIYLAPFSDAQIRAYLKRRFALYRSRKRKQVESFAQKLPDVAARPLLLDFLCDLAGPERKLPNSYQVYKEILDLRLERGRKKEAGAGDLRNFMGALAILLFAGREKRGGERMPHHEMAPLARKCGIDLAAWHLTAKSPLDRDVRGNYRFSHRSILEFLLAEKILKKDEEILRFPPALWTDQMKRFLQEGLARMSVGVPGRFARFEGGTIQSDELGKAFEVRPFEIFNYLVTNREYEEFDPSHRAQRDRYSDQDDQPVVNLSWEDANQFCRWLSENTGRLFRLPTEAEWEFAASGGGKRPYPWGFAPPAPERANYGGAQIGKTTPVGAYPLGMTPEGLFDMGGSVWEWCDDRYDEGAHGRAVRGGSFVDGGDGLRCAARLRISPRYHSNDVGFRVVRTLE